MYNSPETATFASPFDWPVQLLENYDAVSLQPHLTGDSNLSSDVFYINQFQSYAPQIGTWYLLQSWPRQSFWDPTYSDTWLALNLTDPNGQILTRQRRAYWDELADAADAWVIPTGEVFFELEQAGFDLTDFYRDDLHASLDLGRYVAKMTLLSTMNRQNAIDIGTMPEIDAIISRVVSSHPDSGYSDFNDDGTIDHADLAVWESSGRSGLDFLAWQSQFGATTGTTLFLIPEPGAFLTALVAFASLLTCRRCDSNRCR